MATAKLALLFVFIFGTIFGPSPSYHPIAVYEFDDLEGNMYPIVPPVNNVDLRVWGFQLLHYTVVFGGKLS